MNQFKRDDMGSMGSMGSSSSSGNIMTMIFHTSPATPLFSSAWTPSSTGAYAGTCIFLVILAVVARCLLVLRSVQEARWRAADANRRYVAVAGGKMPLAEQVAVDPDARHMTLSKNGVEEHVVVVEQRRLQARPWRFSAEPARALLDTAIAGVGYLLMLGVMTMNVGYFLSVLAGVFVGSLAVGRYGHHLEH